MISYVTIGVDDIQRAMTFYDAVLGTLGHKRIYAADGWLGYSLADGSYMPRIWICNPENGNPAAVGNGSMLGLHAASPADVVKIYGGGSNSTISRANVDGSDVEDILDHSPSSLQSPPFIPNATQ